MSTRPPGYYGPDSFGGTDFPDDPRDTYAPASGDPHPMSSSITVTETHTHVCVRCGFFGTPPAPDAWVSRGFFSTERDGALSGAGRPYRWRRLSDSIFHTTDHADSRFVADACGPVVPIALTDDLRELALDSLEALVRGACVRALGAERGPAAVDLYTRVVQLRRAPAGMLTTSSWSSAGLLTGNNTVRQWITALTVPTPAPAAPVPEETIAPEEAALDVSPSFTLVRVSTPRADNGGGLTGRRRLAHLVYAQQLEQLSQTESIETRCGYRLSTWRRASDGHAAGYPLCERCQRANATGV